MVRVWPNIALTGTPGTGKSTHAELIMEALPAMRHISIGDVVKEHGFHEGYDEEYQTYDVDEDALLDYIEPMTGSVAPQLDEDGDEESDEDHPAKGGAAVNTTQGNAVTESDDDSSSSNDRGGLLLDWHCCEAYPERWIDLVVVLRCNHEILWKRLEKRGYPLAKIQDNNECEIMETVLSEAREAYPAEAIVELTSESNDDVEGNVARIVAWIKTWREQHGFPSAE